MTQSTHRLLVAAALSAASFAQTLVRDIYPPPGSAASSSPETPVAMNGVAYFAATDEFGTEL